MYLEMLRENPLNFLIYLVYTFGVLLISLVLHECSHAYIAWRCGDPTAKMLGRLTLDPRKHLDPIGSICLVLFGYGWAKPVPISPRFFKNGAKDDFLVSIAGIVMNLTLFLISLALAVLVNRFLWTRDFYDYLAQNGNVPATLSTGWNVGYQIYSGTLESRWMASVQAPWLLWVQRFLLMMATVNLSLALFNFLPIPPLDGYHIVNDLLFKGRFSLNANTYRLSWMLLMFLCFSGILSQALGIAHNAVYNAVLNLFLRIGGL